MGTILHGIKNFLQLINDNWPLIIAIIGLAFGLFKKIYGFFTKSEEERIAIAKEQIRSTVLKMITDAEEEYADYVKASFATTNNKALNVRRFNEWHCSLSSVNATYFYAFARLPIWCFTFFFVSLHPIFESYFITDETYQKFLHHSTHRPRKVNAGRPSARIHKHHKGYRGTNAR